MPETDPSAAHAVPQQQALHAPPQAEALPAYVPARRARRGRPVSWFKKVRRDVRAAIILAAMGLLGLVPFRLACAIGRTGGVIAYYILWWDRRRALQHLAMAFPEKSPEQRRSLAIESFRHLGQCAAECAKSRTILKRIHELVELPESSRRLLHEAMAEGRGAVMVSGHVGNWELLPQRLVREGFDAWVVARELNTAIFNHAVERFRTRGGVTTIWRGSPSVIRETLRVFRDNGMLGLLIDQDTKVRSIFVPFFGIPASTPSAAGDLSVRTGAPLLAAFIHRRPGNRHIITMERISIEPTGDPEADSRLLTAAATQAIERAIRREPAQWVWLHRRWKTQPSN